MAEVKLTKNELRAQQLRLGQLKRYLPTLQLKKAMLQSEVAEAKQKVEEERKHFHKQEKVVEAFSRLLTQGVSVEIDTLAQISQVHKQFDNIAGVEVAYLDRIDFEELNYSLMETPPWLDQGVAQLRELVTAKVRITLAEEKQKALEKELREVSIRVNLFEKVLIPRSMVNIKKIKIFLGDQELAAVSQAKVAKEKIMAQKARKREEEAHAH